MSDLPNPNSFAVAGCQISDFGGWDWTSLYLINGIIWIYYGVLLMASPFQMLPTKGKWRFAWLGFDAAIKDEAECKYDIWSKAQAQFWGVSMFSHGLFSIWATENRSDFDVPLTFFTVTTVSFALGLVIFLYNVGTSFKSWKPMTYGWGVIFLVNIILSIVILSDSDTDTKQLLDHEEAAYNLDEPTLAAGPVLWWFFAFTFVGGLNILVTSFDPFEKKFGAAFYLKANTGVAPAEGEAKDAFATTKLGRAVQRGTGAVQIKLSLIFLWAAMNYGADNGQYGMKLSFPMAEWIGNLVFLGWLIGHYVNMDGFWEQFAVVQSTLIISGMTAVFMAGWAGGCAHNPSAD